MYEHFFQCPFCWEEISMLVDSSVTMQSYIEDCEVCCNPIEIKVAFQDNALVSLEIMDLGQ